MKRVKKLLSVLIVIALFASVFPTNMAFARENAGTKSEMVQQYQTDSGQIDEIGLSEQNPSQTVSELATPMTTEDDTTTQEFFKSEADKLITFDVIKDKNTTANEVITNLKLATSGASSNLKISWVSSNTAIVSNSGVVTRPAYGMEDKSVTLTATVTKGLMWDYDYGLDHPGDITPVMITIEITVKAVTKEEYEAALQEGKSVVDYALNNINIENLTIGEGDVMDPNSVTYDISLVDPRNYYDPDVLPKVTVDYVSSGFWTSSNPDVLTVNYLRGKVTRPGIGKPDQTVTLTLTATKGYYSDTKTFEVTIKALTQGELDTEAANLAKVRDALNFDVIKKDNQYGPQAVVSNLQPVYRGIIEGENVTWVTTNKGERGAKIEWKYGTGISSGTVTRPTLNETASYAEATISSIRLAGFVNSVTQKIDLTILATNENGVLTQISLDGAPINKSLDLISNKFEYETTVEANRDSVVVSATGAGALISINGGEPMGGTPSAVIPLATGINVITITSKALGSETVNTYTLRLIRASAATASVHVRIEGDNTTIAPRTHLDIIPYDLTQYGLTGNSSYPSAMHALISTLKSLGLDPKEKSILNMTSSGYVMSICGVGDSTSSWMYMVNGKVPSSTAIADYALHEGDNIVFFCADWMNGYLTQFNKEEATVVVSQKLPLILTGESLMDIVFGQQTQTIPISGAKLLLSKAGQVSADDETSIITGVDGKAEISFAVPGKYLVSAVRKGTGGSIDISRPYCEVTVTANESDQAAANVVIAQIAALPATITLVDQSSVQAARAAYAALSEAQKALVTNLAILTEAEATLAQLQGGGGDTIPPVITVKDLADQTLSEDLTTAEPSFSFKVTAQDEKDGPISPSVQLNSTALTAGSDGTYTCTLTTGSNTITVTATDAAGNKAEKSLKVTLGTSAAFTIQRVGDETFKNGQEARLKVKVSNQSSMSQEAILIVALYRTDGGNKMVNYAYISKTIKAGDQEELGAGFPIPESGTYAIKGFVWNNMDDMEAIMAEPVIVDVAQS
ncbi:MAG TPA: immunoglobulin-like domain-containing protein [Desulfosporosinus sp.]|nr:immunoglobulin-like domain-containing protein [Desulfosporosinus sp.]